VFFKNNINDNIPVSQDILQTRLLRNSPSVVFPKEALFETARFALLRNVDYLRLRHPLFTDHWPVCAVFSCKPNEIPKLNFDEK
jgi:hypothetical protein